MAEGYQNVSNWKLLALKTGVNNANIQVTIPNEATDILIYSSIGGTSINVPVILLGGLAGKYLQSGYYFGANNYGAFAVQISSGHQLGYCTISSVGTPVESDIYIYYK